MNYEVLEHNKSFAAVKLNPIGYTAELFGGRRRGLLSLTSSYSWKGKRIGLSKNLFQVVASSASHDEVRPVFLFGTSVNILHPSDEEFKNEWLEASVAFQAGPTLVWGGNVDIRSRVEIFRGDTIRRTQHTAIGVTKASKIIALYASSASMHELARKLISLGCTKGMKCDGGHMSHLHFIPPVENKKSPPMSIGPYSIPTGICFHPK